MAAAAGGPAPAEVFAPVPLHSKSKNCVFARMDGVSALLARDLADRGFPAAVSRALREAPPGAMVMAGSAILRPVQEAAAAMTRSLCVSTPIQFCTARR